MEIPINFQAEMKTKPKSVSLSNMTILLSLMDLGVNAGRYHNRLANLHCTVYTLLLRQMHYITYLLRQLISYLNKYK